MTTKLEGGGEALVVGPLVEELFVAASLRWEDLAFPPLRLVATFFGDFFELFYDFLVAVWQRALLAISFKALKSRVQQSSSIRNKQPKILITNWFFTLKVTISKNFISTFSSFSSPWLISRISRLKFPLSSSLSSLLENIYHFGRFSPFFPPP